MKSVYPRAFLTPAGRMVSVTAMARALKTVREQPDAEYKGWEWYAVTGHSILATFRAGLHDRINRRIAPQAATR